MTCLNNFTLVMPFVMYCAVMTVYVNWSYTSKMFKCFQNNLSWLLQKIMLSDLIQNVNLSKLNLTGELIKKCRPKCIFKLIWLTAAISFFFQRLTPKYHLTNLASHLFQKCQLPRKKLL